MSKAFENIILFFISCFLFPVSYFAQDIHFSQFYQAPLFVNPAMTGAFTGDVRASLHYKDQWANVGSPYKTYAFSYDMVLMKEKFDAANLGAGITVFNDIAGDTKMGTTQINLSAAGIVPVNENNNVSAGLQVGFAQRSMDDGDTRWNSQYVNGNYNANVNSGEVVTFDNTGFWDLSGGLSWNFIRNESEIAAIGGIRANAGIAFFHLNRPKQEFYTFLDDDRLYSKMIVHAGAFISLKNMQNIAILPSVFFQKQGPVKEIDFGTMVRYTLKEDSEVMGIAKETAVSIGGYYRVGDAIVPAIMLEVGNFGIGITYDVNVSDLNAVTSGKGGFEISLRYLNPNPFKAKASEVKFL